MFKSLFDNFYFITVKDKSGSILFKTYMKNLVTAEATDYLQNIFFKGKNYNAAWYCGLKGPGSPSYSDTLSNHPSWAELTAYQETERPLIEFSDSINGLITTSDSIKFTINGTLTVSGLFITNDSEKGGSNGILFGVGDFPKILNITDNILEVTIHIRHKGFYFWDALPVGSYSINLTGQTSWTAPHIPIRNTIKVWYNGIYQEIDVDYQVNNQNFTFYNVEEDDVVSVYYHYFVGGDVMAVGFKREKYVLAPNQTQVGLSENPDPDSVLVFMDGSLLGKDDEYLLDTASRTITFLGEITGGEKVEVVYVVA